MQDKQFSQQTIIDRSRQIVCLLVPSYWKPVMGGAQYQAKVLLEQMVEQDRFELHYLARRLDGEGPKQGYSLHRIGNSNGLFFLLDTRKLLLKLKKLRPDVIYVHVGTAYLGIAAKYCRENNCRLIWHIASDIDTQRWSLRQRRNPIMSFVDKKVMEYGMRRADVVVAQTKHQKALLLQNYRLDAAEIIPNFHPEPTECMDKSLPAEIVWVANLKTVKQPELFVALAKRLLDLPVRCVMYGGMQLVAEKASSLLADIKETENLEWAGAVSQEEVNRKLATASLLVNTSTYEGFSNTFIQAWQRRVPVCSLNTDPDQLLSAHGLGGVAHGSLDKLEKLVREFLDDQSTLREDTGKAAQAYASKNHGIDVADQLIEIINNQPS